MVTESRVQLRFFFFFFLFLVCQLKKKVKRARLMKPLSFFFFPLNAAL